MPEMITARLGAGQRLLSRYESEGDEYLCSIVTVDGSWGRHDDPELKSQSLGHRHLPFPRKKTVQYSLFRRKTHGYSWLGPRKHNFRAVRGQRYDYGLGDFGEGPQEFEERITRVLQRKTQKAL